MCSRYQSNPGDAHWNAAKNILKYLRRTKDHFLVYGGESELRVEVYTDASFQTDNDDFRSQSGFIFCLNRETVSWKSSKQSTIADSTAEAEYITASDAAKEAVWMKKFISDLGVKLKMGLSCIVIVKVPLLKARNQDHIQNPNTFSGCFISFARFFIETM